MTYINLTAQQARYFNEHGRILIVEKMEPQPDRVIDKNPKRIVGGWDIYKEIKSPYRIGEVYGFKEPWAEAGAAPHSLMPDCAVRIFGKCVKSEARKVDSMTFDEMMITGLISKERFDLAYEDYMDGDLDAIPELRLSLDENIDEGDWCFFSLFEKCEKGGV